MYELQCTQYIQVQSQYTLTTGFRGTHRDAELRDFTAPALAQEDADSGSPCPEDGDFFNGRPDAAEIVEAISKF